MLKDYLKSLGWRLVYEYGAITEWRLGDDDDVTRQNLQFVAPYSWYYQWFTYDYDDNSENFHEIRATSLKEALEYVD